MSDQLPAILAAIRNSGNTGGGGDQEPPIDAEFEDVSPNNPPPNDNRPKDEENAPPEIRRVGWLFWTLQIIGLVFIIGMIGFGIGDWNGVLFQVDDIRFNVGPVPVLIGIAYLVASLINGRIRETEIGGAYFYSTALKDLDSGLHFLPFGLMQLIPLPKGVLKIQVPDNDPEKIFHGPDTEELRVGMVRTLRILTGGPTAGTAGNNPEAVDALHARMMLEANYVVQFRIKSVLDFIGNYESEGGLRDQLRDVGDPTLAEAFSTRTPAEISSELADINKTLDDTIGGRFKRGGIQFISARVTIDPGHTVSGALATIPTARAKAHATVLEAEGNRIAAIKKGEGEGGADKARLTGRGQGLKAMKDDLGVDGETVIAAETAREVAEELATAGTIVIGAGGGMGDIVGAAKVIQNAFKK